MQNNIKFSIIVPVYNVECYLSKCLISLINQTYTNIEIICIDDGSTDNSIQVLEEYKLKDDRIKIIKQENCGVSVARNVGIENASGDYILFVDADDWLETDACEILEHTLKNTESELILFYHYRVMPNCRIKSSLKINDSHLYNNMHKLLDKEQEFVLSNALAPLWNKLFKRDLIVANNIRFPIGLKWFEDGIFILKYYALDPKTIVIDKFLYNYTCSRQGSLTYGNKQKLLEYRYNSFNAFKEAIKENQNVKINKYFIDYYFYSIFPLWKTFGSNDKYLKLLLDIICLYEYEKEVPREVKLGKLQAWLIRNHLVWWYWKLIRPIGKYCIVLPYRRIKKVF